MINEKRIFQCVICNEKADYYIQKWYVQFCLCDKNKMYTLRKPKFYEVESYYIDKKEKRNEKRKVT